MTPLIKILKFLGLIILFYVLPLSYLYFGNSNLYLVYITFLIIFPLGYTIIYMMMHDDISIDISNSDNLEKFQGNSNTYLEQDMSSSTMRIKKNKFKILGRGFLYHLIPFLILMFILLHYTDFLKTNELRNLSQNMLITVKSTGNIMSKLIKATVPNDLKYYKYFEKNRKILNIMGKYDKAELVLSTMKLKYNSVYPWDVYKKDLSKYKIIFINCPGQLPKRDMKKIQTAVKNGAWLFTTDWAVKYALPSITPGYVDGEGKTGNKLYAITKILKKHPFCKYLIPEGSLAKWWVFFSYPIKILNSEKVKIIMKSKLLGDELGNDALAVTYKYKKGRVIHVIGHFYQQFSDSDGTGTAYKFVKDKLKVPSSKISNELKAILKNIPTSKFEQAYSIMRLIANVVIENRKKK